MECVNIFRTFALSKGRKKEDHGLRGVRARSSGHKSKGFARRMKNEKEKSEKRKYKIQDTKYNKHPDVKNFGTMSSPREEFREGPQTQNNTRQIPESAFSTRSRGAAIWVFHNNEDYS